MTKTPTQKAPYESVGILLGHATWFFMLGIGRALKENYGSRITFYTTNQESLKYLEKTCPDHFYDDAVMYDFNGHDRVLNDDSLHADVVAKAQEWEKKLGSNYQDIIASNRHFGHAYGLGAFYYGRSFKSEKFTYYDVLNFYNEELDYWDNEFESKGLTLFLNPLRGQYVIAKYKNLPTRDLINARFKDYFFWSHCPQILNWEIETEYRKLEGQEFKPYAFDAIASSFDKANRQKMFSRKSDLIGFVKFAKQMVKSRIIQHIRRDEARHGASLMSKLGGSWRAIQNKKKMLDPAYVSRFDDFKDKPYFYFPLQHEPENNLQGSSPDFMSQLWAITLCAKAMPAGCFLVVKEHLYPLGVRPDNFYDQIKGFKNVIFASLDTHGMTLTEKAKGVITITGTSGYEAAMMGVPGIVMRSNCDYTFMDHVHHCPAGQGIDEAVRLILDGDSSSADKAKADGGRMIEAIKNSGFQRPDFSLSNLDNITDESLKDALAQLDKSFA